MNCLKSERGIITADEDSGTIVVKDTAAHIKEMKRIVSVLEEKDAVAAFQCKAPAKDVCEILRNWVEDKKVGHVSVHEASNQIIVKSLPRRMDEVEAIVKQLGGKRVDLDKPEKPERAAARFGVLGKYSYAWLTLAFFVISLLLHWYFGWQAFQDTAREHGQQPQLAQFVTEAARDTFENWQLGHQFFPIRAILRKLYVTVKKCLMRI